MVGTKHAHFPVLGFFRVEVLKRENLRSHTDCYFCIIFKMNRQLQKCIFSLRSHLATLYLYVINSRMKTKCGPRIRRIFFLEQFSNTKSIILPVQIAYLYDAKMALGRLSSRMLGCHWQSFGVGRCFSSKNNLKNFTIKLEYLSFFVR